MRVVLHLTNGRRIDLVGLSDEATIWLLRRIPSAAAIVSTRHIFDHRTEAALVAAFAARLEHLWVARWN